MWISYCFNAPNGKKEESKSEEKKEEENKTTEENEKENDEPENSKEEEVKDASKTDKEQDKGDTEKKEDEKDKDKKDVSGTVNSPATNIMCSKYSELCKLSLLIHLFILRNSQIYILVMNCFYSLYGNFLSNFAGSATFHTSGWFIFCESSDHHGHVLWSGWIQWASIHHRDSHTIPHGSRRWAGVGSSCSCHV